MTLVPTRFEEASKPNPALQPFTMLIGTWTTVGRHPLVPDTVFHGRAVFEWVEGGAFLKWSSEVDEPGIPTGIAIIGSDDSTGETSMLYFDERGVSRRYVTSMQDGVWKWWRNAPGFSQRYTFTLSDDGRSMVGKGEMSKEDSTWEPDLASTYTRAP
ncbi:MAG: hypothetical protein ACJ77R_13905 [Gemmatimonadaceae bacterium]